MFSNPRSPVPNPELDALVRRVDEDRWLASRFAPADVRAKLIALYAVNYEMARTVDVVREPGIGAIRLAWWREAIEEIAQGKTARAHPALLALQASWSVAPNADAFAAMAEARAGDLDDAPFENEAALTLYIDATAGMAMRLATGACGSAAGQADAFIRHAAQAWGYAGLARTRRRAGFDLIARAEAAYAQARPLARALPSAIFPAIGYVAFVPAYLRALREKRGPPSVLTRQLKLIAASATGRI